MSSFKWNRKFKYKYKVYVEVKQPTNFVIFSSDRFSHDLRGTSAQLPSD